MGINIVVDEILVEEVKRLTGISDDSAAIDAALRRALPRTATCSQEDATNALLKIGGTVQFFDGCDPEAEFGGARPPHSRGEREQ